MEVGPIGQSGANALDLVEELKEKRTEQEHATIHHHQITDRTALEAVLNTLHAEQVSVREMEDGPNGVNGPDAQPHATETGVFK